MYVLDHINVCLGPHHCMSWTTSFSNAFHGWGSLPNETEVMDNFTNSLQYVSLFINNHSSEIWIDKNLWDCMPLLT